MKSIFCIAESPNQAYHVVSRLRAAGIGRQSISMLRQWQYRAEAAAGGTLERTLELLSGLDTVKLSGRGAFVAAGPIRSILAAEGTANQKRRLIYLLKRVGVPKSCAASYESAITRGSALIAVSGAGRRALSIARQVLAESDTQAIRAMTLPDGPELAACA